MRSGPWPTSRAEICCRYSPPASAQSADEQRLSPGDQSVGRCLLVLALLERYSDQPADGQDAPIPKLTMELREFGPATTEFTLTHERIPDQESQDRAPAGWSLSLDKLAEISDRNTF